jgi:signal peptide peptidase SppA
MNPVLAALLAEAWAMEPRRLEAMLAEISAVITSGAKLDTSAFFGLGGPAAAPKLEVDGNGVATIPVRGVLMRSVHPILKAFGFGGADLSEIRTLLLDAVVRDDVKAIRLEIDSPGGTVSGTKELADEVFSTRGLKPITAHASGAMASAAYWIASQADKITATVSTVVGSIGVFGVMRDASKAAADAGVKVHVIASHPLKGAGDVPGAPVSDAQLADMQRHVNTLASLFNADVVRGRAMSAEAVAVIATGQVWVGEEAQAKGLVDEIDKAGIKQKEKAMDIEKLKAELAAKTTEAAKVPGLEAKVAELTAKLAELDALVKVAHATHRDLLLAKYEDRIAPADLAAIKEYGEFCGANLEKFEAHLKARPAVTRATRVSSPGATPEGAQPEIPAAVLAVAKQMGNSAEDLRKYGG